MPGVDGLEDRGGSGEICEVDVSGHCAVCEEVWDRWMVLDLSGQKFALCCLQEDWLLARIYQRAVDELTSLFLFVEFL